MRRHRASGLMASRVEFDHAAGTATRKEVAVSSKALRTNERYRLATARRAIAISGRPPSALAIRFRNSRYFASPVAMSLVRSEEHTSELQSHHDLVCRLLLE